MKANTRIKHTTLWKLLDPDHFRDKQDFNHLLLVTEGTLSDLTQWSLVPEQCREQFFNPNKVLVELAGQEGKIVGASCLFLDQTYMNSVCKELGISTERVAVLGRSMVLPNYRGQHLMYELNKLLIPFAVNRGIETLISTVHPENQAGKKSLQKLGMMKQGETTEHGNPRDIMLMNLI